MTEEWKDIEGYENLYQVSNLGRVKNIQNDKIRKLVYNRKGYHMVKLCKNGKSKGFSVHRLVAQAFIPNPDNLPQVNHINEFKDDNRAENLEWCTNEYNHNYGTRNMRVSQKLIGNHNMKTCLGKLGKEHHSSKPILQFTLDDKLVKLWFSASDVNRELGYNFKNISSCCKGKRVTAHKYKWMFLDVYLADWWDMEMDKHKEEKKRVA